MKRREVRTSLEHNVSFIYDDLNDGINYLGYSLKSNNNGKADWMWLLSMIERSVKLWCNNCI